jgi:hypothetical protein
MPGGEDPAGRGRASGDPGSRGGRGRTSRRAAAKGASATRVLRKGTPSIAAGGRRPGRRWARRGSPGGPRGLPSPCSVTRRRARSGRLGRRPGRRRAAGSGTADGRARSSRHASRWAGSGRLARWASVPDQADRMRGGSGAGRGSPRGRASSSRRRRPEAPLRPRGRTSCPASTWACCSRRSPSSRGPAGLRPPGGPPRLRACPETPCPAQVTFDRLRAGRAAAHAGAARAVSRPRVEVELLAAGAQHVRAARRTCPRGYGPRADGSWPGPSPPGRVRRHRWPHAPRANALVVLEARRVRAEGGERTPALLLGNFLERDGSA